MGEASTDKSDEWIFNVLNDNPALVLESGNLRLPPARLSFPYLFKKQEPMEPGGTAKFAATFLFHPLTDLEVVKGEVRKLALSKHPDYGQKGGPHLQSPFRDQEEKERFDGYLPGGVFITATGERRIPVVDRKLIPIVDEEKVYPGVWVIGTVRPFYYSYKVKKGLSFGLQSVMVVSDDQQLGGGGSDPNKDFAGVKGFDVTRETKTSF